MVSKISFIAFFDNRYLVFVDDHFVVKTDANKKPCLRYGLSYAKSHSSSKVVLMYQHPGGRRVLVKDLSVK